MINFVIGNHVAVISTFQPFPVCETGSGIFFFHVTILLSIMVDNGSAVVDVFDDHCDSAELAIIFLFNGDRDSLPASVAMNTVCLCSAGFLPFFFIKRRFTIETVTVPQRMEIPEGDHSSAVVLCFDFRPSALVRE